MCNQHMFKPLIISHKNITNNLYNKIQQIDNQYIPITNKTILSNDNTPRLITIYHKLTINNFRVIMLYCQFMYIHMLIVTTH